MLELKNISFKVKALDSNEEITILDDISFTIDTGKILVITGPNGGGKSTLAKVITGILKPTSGKIIFNDVDGIKNLSANLASGKKAQGFVAFEVNKNWENFEIHYKEFLGDRTLVFKVSNIEGA